VRIRGGKVKERKVVWLAEPMVRKEERKNRDLRRGGGEGREVEWMWSGVEGKDLGRGATYLRICVSVLLQRCNAVTHIQ